MSLDKLFDDLKDAGHLKAKPFSGQCIFCGKQLDEFDLDHSVCNKCWSDAFDHKFIGEEDDLDTCKDCGEQEDHESHQNWEKAHRDIEPDWIEEANAN